MRLATADEIADMAARGEDISAYFTNRFTVVRPARRVSTSGGGAVIGSQERNAS